MNIGKIIQICTLSEGEATYARLVALDDFGNIYSIAANDVNNGKWEMVTNRGLK